MHSELQLLILMLELVYHKQMLMVFQLSLIHIFLHRVIHLLSVRVLTES